MKDIYILNPAAGQGRAMKYKGRENAYVTKGVNDAYDFVKKILEGTCEDINFIVCGGDGTVNEVVHAVIDSGTDRAYISLVPTGTGNDLIRTVNEQDAECVQADVLTANEYISVNAINTGFDLDVVQRADQYKKKPFISGSMAYILGVITTLFNHYGTRMRIDYIDQNGKELFFKGECLLAVAGNGKYYGGGFKPSPVASITDGLIDLMIVKKVSRLKFIALVGKYKKGLHIDPSTGCPFKKFEDILIFEKCKSVTISGIEKICCDGEILPAQRVRIGIAAHAVKILNKKGTAKI